MNLAMALRPSTPAAVPTTIEDTRWKQVLDRDAAAGFIYGVQSTGIFCRPSCPSRRPDRIQVRFFDTTAEAAAAGFRACKRCRPTERPHDRFAEPVSRAAAYLAAHSDETVTLDELARITETSPFSLQKNFKRILGVTPKEFAAAKKLERLRKHLPRGRVTDATYEAGFSSPSRMYQAAEALGMTPGEAGRGAHGLTIHFATSECSLGLMLVAATDKGICSIAFGDSAYQLEVDLRARFPHAEIEPTEDDPMLTQGIRFVLAQLRSAPHELDLPLDLRATVFQQRVWKALREIPRGETRTYAEVAKSMGQPTATRAVARACATNPVAVAIPCHRVIGSDGKLTGYRWGVERKKRLLEMESR